LELLARVFPDEYGRREPVQPLLAPTPIRVAMYGTLPSGNIASVEEMHAVARQWHEAAQPREQTENKPNEDEPMTHWYNPVTRRVEPREPTDDGADCEGT
jgi:hypothetical protein